MFLIEQYRYDVIIIFSNRVAVSYRHWLPCRSNALVHSENLARSRSRQLFQQSRLLLWSCDTVWIEINNFLHFFAYQQFKRYNCFDVRSAQCSVIRIHIAVCFGLFFSFTFDRMPNSPSCCRKCPVTPTSTERSWIRSGYMMETEQFLFRP